MYQLKEKFYNWREDVRPHVIGKFDERGEWDVHNPRGRGDWLLPPQDRLFGCSGGAGDRCAGSAGWVGRRTPKA